MKDDYHYRTEMNLTVSIKFSERFNNKNKNLTPWEMVRAAMLLRAPASPLSLTATAISAREGTAGGAGNPASWRLASRAFLTSSRKAEDRSSTMWAIVKIKRKKINQTEKERKISKSKEKCEKEKQKSR
jgi:hypothetical protein